MSKIEELKQEATDLGIAFSPNIGEATLAKKIEDYYASQETTEKAIQTAVEVVAGATTGVKTGGKRSIYERAAEAEKVARKTRIVTITDNDQRENNFTTVVSVNCSNDFFDLGTKRIPLNVPVELEQGFINVLKEIVIPMHTRSADGQAKTVMRNRYSLAFNDELKSE